MNIILQIILNIIVVVFASLIIPVIFYEHELHFSGNFSMIVSVITIIMYILIPCIVFVFYFNFIGRINKIKKRNIKCRVFLSCILWVFIVLLEKEIIKFIEYEIIPLIYTYGEYKKILAFGIDLDIWDAIVIISSAILIVGIVLIVEIFYMKKFNKQ